MTYKDLPNEFLGPTTFRGLSRFCFMYYFYNCDFTKEWRINNNLQNICTVFFASKHMRLYLCGERYVLYVRSESSYTQYKPPTASPNIPVPTTNSAPPASKPPSPHPHPSPPQAHLSQTPLPTSDPPPPSSSTPPDSHPDSSPRTPD